MDMPARSELAQTHEVLVQLARGRFGHIAPETIATYVLAVTDGADWPVRKAKRGRRLRA